MALAPALAELGVLVLVLWAIALALASYLIIRVALKPIIDLLGSIPLVGGKLKGVVQGLDRLLQQAANAMVQGADKLIGLSLHLLAVQWNWFWSEFKRYSVLFQLITGALLALHRLVAKAESLARGHHINLQGINDAIKRLEKRFHGIDARVKTIEHDIAQGIGNDVRGTVKHLRKELTHLEKAVPREIGAAERQAEAAISDLRGFLAIRPGITWLRWAEAVVVAALGAGVVNLFKCSTFLGKSLARGCGLWDALESLFGMFIDVFLFANFCHLWGVAEPLFAEILTPVTGVISTFADGACSQRPGSWQAMNVPLNTATQAEIETALTVG